MSHNYSTTANNPQDWFGQDYNFSMNYGYENLTLSLNQEDAVGDTTGTGYGRMSDDGFTNMTVTQYLHNTTGDVRYAYHTLLRYLWDKYDAKDQDATHVMPEGLKMTRNAVRDRDTDTRYVTYTVSFIEGELSTTDTVGSRIIKPENNL